VGPTVVYEQLCAARNEQRARMERRISRSTLEILGCGIPRCTALARLLVRARRESLAGGGAWFDELDPYWDHACLEVRIVARETLVLVGRACLSALTEDLVRRITDASDSWVVLDKFAHRLVGPAVLAGVLRWEFLLSLRSTDPATHRGERDPRGEDPSAPGRFSRRCALVASTAFNTPRHADAEKPLELLDPPVCEDRDTMTWKAVSWTLRALAKNAPARAAQFLDRPPAPLHPSVVREVRNVLRTGRKSGAR
jgi:3-methyladenine DNA glycosylase AlkD